MSYFWEGTGGALIGAATSGIVAVVAIVWTRRDSRDLMREEMSLRAAHEALRYASASRRRSDPFLNAHRPEARIDWSAVAAFVADAEDIGEQFAAFQALIRPPRIAGYLMELWEDYTNVPDRLTPTVIGERDRKALDEVARNIGQLLTNAMDELENYLRADLERRTLASLPLRRRYRLNKRAPFVRRTQQHEVLERDEFGLPKADY